MSFNFTGAEQDYLFLFSVAMIKMPLPWSALQPVDETNPRTMLQDFPRTQQHAMTLPKVLPTVLGLALLRILFPEATSFANILPLWVAFLLGQMAMYLQYQMLEGKAKTE
jgi:hypothetical protein